MNGENSEDGGKPQSSMSSGRSEHQDAPPLLSIGAMAKQYQVTLRTLRFYEQSGLLKPMRRGSTRLYSVSDCQRLALILEGRQLGFSLTEIQDLLLSQDRNTEASHLDSILTPARIIAQIENLERQRDELEKSISDLSNLRRKLSQR
jgi:DNA-binding transcriptional MerR regulator